MNTDATSSAEPQPASTVQVPNAGSITVSNFGVAATTVATLYNEREMRRRPQMRSPNSQLFPLRGRNIVNGIEAIVGGLAVANGALAMRQRVPGRGRPVSFMFKNDAEIILQPYRVDTPPTLLYNNSPSTIFPNECTVCTMHLASGIPTNGTVNFRFAVITTDPALTGGGSNLPTLDLEVSVRLTAAEYSLEWITINGIRATSNAPMNTVRLFHFRSTGLLPSFGVVNIPCNPGGIDGSLGGVIAFAPVLR